MRTFKSLVAALAIGLSAASFSATAQAEYPDRPIRLLVPSAPGGSADFVARLLGERLGRKIGQTVVVENRGGGGGNIATEAVAKAPADGYTLLLTGNNHSLNVFLFDNPPYALTDFVAVIEATRGPSVFVSPPTAEFSTLQEMITQAKASPDTIAYGSPGVGLPSHVAAELFQRAADIRLVHVPYRGSGPSLIDAVGGQIPLVSSTLAAALTHIQGGRLTPLAVTSDTRWPDLPDVPTVQEVLGTPFSHLTWLGILAPAGTSPEIVAKLNGALNEVLQDPQVRKMIQTQGTNAQGGSAQAFQTLIDEEAATAEDLVKRAGLKAN